MTPAIFGLEGPTLSAAERGFFKDTDPAGIILFKRNIETPSQVKALTASVRHLLGRDLLVLIDQEGGRVQRLGPPQWRAAPALAFFGKAYEKAPELAEKALYLNFCLIARDLGALGINVDCLPCLDVPVQGADSIIGDRAFSSYPHTVARLGGIVCDALLSSRVFPVIKHIPGHGRAKADSHKTLPVIDARLRELEKTDFVPFRALRSEPLAMTAHVTFSAIDPDHPATLSKKVIGGVIRDKIGFTGLLISDDITMKALSGGFRDRAQKCLAAGIDLVLHCSGDLAEMQDVMAGAGKMNGAGERKLKKLLSSHGARFSGERPEMLREYRALEQKLKTLGSD